MHRVLSFQMSGISGRGFGESSEFVTKRMCFSFIFFIGFLALLGGFLLGRMTAERNVQLREERKQRLELANDILRASGSPPHLHYYNLFLEELRNSSFDEFNFTKKFEKDGNIEDDHKTDRENLMTILSASTSFHKVIHQKFSSVVTLRGSSEPGDDGRNLLWNMRHSELLLGTLSYRWVVLSVSNDGIGLALRLIKVLEKLSKVYNWQPQRTIIFCFFDIESYDSCLDVIPKYSKSGIVAHLAVHGNAIQREGCFATSGSDVIESMISETVQESISAFNFDDFKVFHSCKTGNYSQIQTFMPRLVSDIPHASISFLKTDNFTDAKSNDESELFPYRRILTQIIGLGIWKLSESVILHWDPKDFESNVKTALKLINSSQFNEVKDKILSTTITLVHSVQSWSQQINDTKNVRSLAMRMTNDLLINLDRTLLCSDINSRSKTDLALIPRLLTESQESISSYLKDMLKCYEDTIEFLQEG